MDNIIEIIKGDITTLKVGAIVNAANSSLMGGGGVDGAIHRAAGPQLKEYCRSLKGCQAGEAKISPSFQLKCKHIIHTVGPVWNNGTQNEEALLASAYRRSLEVAIENKIQSIAFPSISTDAYRFPFDKATLIAKNEIERFMKTNNTLQTIILVTFSESDYNQMKRIYEKPKNNYQNQ